MVYAIIDYNCDQRHLQRLQTKAPYTQQPLLALADARINHVMSWRLATLSAQMCIEALKVYTDSKHHYAPSGVLSTQLVSSFIIPIKVNVGTEGLKRLLRKAKSTSQATRKGSKALTAPLVDSIHGSADTTPTLDKQTAAASWAPLE